jgi:hypothetical protein
MIEKLRAILIGGEEKSDRSWVGIKLQSTVQPEEPRDFNDTWMHIHRECKKISCGN